VDQDPAALHVGKELVPQPGTTGRPLDQARDVGQDQLAIPGVQGAQYRFDRRERIGRDLGRGPRQAPEE
jgi:hypothetical protein